MDLTQEQIQSIADIVLEKCKNMFTEVNVILKDVITKQALNEILTNTQFDFITKGQLNEFRTSVSQDIAKANEAITKVASETETKIKALETSAPAVKKHWYDREL